MLVEACVMVVAMVAGQAGSVEARAIRDVVNQLAIHWNEKDARAFAELFTADADYVTSRGTVFAGREDLQYRLSEAFRNEAYRASQQKRMDASIRFLSPNIALVDSPWELSDVRASDGKKLPAQRGYATMILVKMDGVWRIAALRAMIPTME